MDTLESIQNPPAAVHQQEHSAVGIQRQLVFWCLAAAGCGADLLSKHWVFSQSGLVAGEVWWWWPEYVGLQLSLNEGALAGIGQGRTGVFAAFSILAAIAIPIWLFIFGAAKDRWLTVTLGCVLGGILGNLYDRLGLHGLDWGPFDVGRTGESVYAVRDFFLLAWNWSGEPSERLVWPNFNLADSLLVGGAISLAFLSLRTAADEPQRDGDGV